jgi:hypothetical protein
MPNKLLKALAVLAIAIPISSCETWNRNLPNWFSPLALSVNDIASQDFCVRYQPVIKEKGDSEFIAQIKKLNIKKRVLANEIQYKCTCEKVTASYCLYGK